MKDKEFKTLEEQIAILESRGLDIPNRDAAKQFLLDSNYYRVAELICQWKDSGQRALLI